MNADYLDYLKSEEWRGKRTVALERAGSRCQVCNSPDRLDVHHRTYERFKDELPEDLTVLCRSCHSLYHSDLRDKMLHLLEILSEDQMGDLNGEAYRLVFASGLASSPEIEVPMKDVDETCDGVIQLRNLRMIQDREDGPVYINLRPVINALRSQAK